MIEFITSNADIINKLAMPAIALVSAIYVLLQYRRGARWKASDLASSLLQQLRSDPELAFACHVLDWGAGPLIVPERYRAILENADVIEYDRLCLVAALRPRLQRSTLKDRRGLIYRYCFDRLFDFLQNVWRLRCESQLRLEDLHDLAYWLERISRYKYAQDFEPEIVFQPFLHAAGYGEVVKLGKALGVDGWLDPNEARAIVGRLELEQDPAARTASEFIPEKAESAICHRAL